MEIVESQPRPQWILQVPDLITDISPSPAEFDGPLGRPSHGTGTKNVSCWHFDGQRFLYGNVLCRRMVECLQT